jgi:arsenate reductase (glutaredoxin)
MPSLVFYGYKKCSTCRKAEKALEAAGRAYTYVDITETPPSAADIKRIVHQSGLEARKAFNTSGEVYKAMNMKDKLAGMGEEAMFKLLAGQGRLCKRPMVTDGKQATIGFDEQVFQKTWG